MNKNYSLGFLANRASFSLAKIHGVYFERNNIDLSYSEFLVLRGLYEEEDMDREILMCPTSKDTLLMREILTGLEGRGIIQKTEGALAEPEIIITEKGKELAEDAIKCADDVMDSILVSVDEQDVLLFSELLDQIYQRAKKLE